MSQRVVYTGKFAGDGTGDPGKTAFDKLNANDAELYAAIAAGGGGISLGYLQTTLTSNTNDFSIGGSFPAGIGQIDFLLNTGAVNLTGLQAGLFNGQTIWIRNSPSSTFMLTLPYENVGSSAANRWSGPTGSLVLIPGDKVAAVYYTTPARWAL